MSKYHDTAPLPIQNKSDPDLGYGYVLTAERREAVRKPCWLYVAVHNTTVGWAGGKLQFQFHKENSDAE